MVSVVGVSGALQPILTTVADEAAKETGFIRRVRQVTGAVFVQTLVFGWLGQPAASYSQLTQMGAVCGLRISAQGLEQRFTAAAATCLRRVLEAAMGQVLAAAPVALPLLRRFNGVYLADSTTIVLPDALAAVWRGCEGRVATNTRAALKVQVRWEFTAGALELLPLQHGRGSDQAADCAAPPLPPGALRLTDLSYAHLPRLTALRAQRVFVLCRLPAQPAVFDATEQQWEAARLLAAQDADLIDLPVTLGTTERVPVRLVARRASSTRAAQRRRQMRQAATREGRTVSAARLALAAWDAYITTAPAEQLSAAEALTLVRVRWQIELLFKLWKSHGRIDVWRSANHWRILCEVYAKLLAMLIQHWCVLLRCWADPYRSLVKAAAVVRQHALTLAGARGRPGLLRAGLATLAQCLAQAGRLTTRRRRPSTAHQLCTLASPTTRSAPVAA